MNLSEYLYLLHVNITGIIFILFADILEYI